MTNRRTTIAETRLEKNETAALVISGFLGNYRLTGNDTIKAVVRISKIGNKFTVYVKAYSRIRDTFRSVESFDTIEKAILNSNKCISMLIEEGFSIIRME